MEGAAEAEGRGAAAEGGGAAAECGGGAAEGGGGGADMDGAAIRALGAQAEIQSIAISPSEMKSIPLFLMIH